MGTTGPDVDLASVLGASFGGSLSIGSESELQMTARPAMQHAARRTPATWVPWFMATPKSSRRQSERCDKTVLRASRSTFRVFGNVDYVTLESVPALDGPALSPRSRPHARYDDHLHHLPSRAVASSTRIDLWPWQPLHPPSFNASPCVTATRAEFAFASSNHT